jgi:hypothetical protein
LVFLCISLYETFEVHFAIPVRIEYVDDALDQRILLQFGQAHEFINAQTAGTIQVEFLETPCQPTQLIGVKITAHLHWKRILVALKLDHFSVLGHDEWWKNLDCALAIF